LNHPKIFVIACAVLALDLKRAARKMGIEIDTKFLEAGLHERPTLLREKLQAAIDQISASKSCARIVIGYGVCGRGTVGIQARGAPLVVPKAHDCIALFLGGDAAYKREFQRYPGTYYLSAGWYEEKTEPFSQQNKYAFYGDKKLYFDELVKKYGQEAADETFRFLNTWKNNYQRAVFIETGVSKSPKYEAHARDMATAYGWQFERLDGNPALLIKLLTTETSTNEILVVPPRHVIDFDAVESTLSARPIWIKEETPDNEPRIMVVKEEQGAGPVTGTVKIGLGIDAGGTYTDTVIYDLDQRQTLCKCKALTTKWDFTIGIGEALAGLDQDLLQRVQLVSLSTTLATNAIVEGDGQKVGMIVMPPYGKMGKGEISYEPKAHVQGQLEINGTEIEPVDESEIRSVVSRMVQENKVKAFAVSGYAGAINPEHELKVKEIIREVTGLVVTCGHELSSILNFKTRAHTAMLNARIIPNLTALIRDLEKTIAKLGILAPIVVVKGDGTLISAELAKERPVETVLSGPAASVAGARHLTGLKDAIVVDMGGTTTDTAILAGGSVKICETGSNVGGHRTHVKALDICTAGLGGDSLITWKEGRFSIGPRRVAPIAWLGSMYPETDRALAALNRHLDKYTVSSQDMQILALTSMPGTLDLTPQEASIVELLGIRPYAIDELIDRTGVLFARGLQLQRLEELHVIQRCGLTLTDMLHVTGRFDRWSRESADVFAQKLALVTKMELTKMAEHLLGLAVDRLTLEILKRQLSEETDPESLTTDPVCRILVNNLLMGGNDQYAVRIELKRPVIGIGAPIHYFLPKIAKNLLVETLLPENADVANAIGAITSHVRVNRHLRIIPNQEGGFLIDGLAGARHFERFKDADAFAREEITRLVRDQALSAGTGSREVELRTEDKMASTAGGKPIFLGRSIHAKISGRPDAVALKHIGTSINK
jgi:N-methylhydantoinase A/oxoprolinase/acetone carboxylase beta subunit